MSRLSRVFWFFAGLTALLVVLSRLLLLGAENPPPAESSADVWLKYTLREAEIAVDFPENAIVCTRDMAPDHPDFAALGRSYDDLFRTEDTDQLQVFAFDPDKELLIRIVTEAVDFPDYRQLGEERLREAVEYAAQQPGAMYRADTFSLYPHPQADFLSLTAAPSDDGEGGYELLFATVRGGVQLYFQFEGVLPFSYRDTLYAQSIVDTLVFLSEAPAPPA